MKTEKNEVRFKYWNDDMNLEKIKKIEEYVGECTEPNFYDEFKRSRMIDDSWKRKNIIDSCDEEGEWDDGELGYPVVPAFHTSSRFRGYYRILPNGKIFKHEARLKRKGKYAEFYKEAPLEFGVDPETERDTVVLWSHADLKPAVHFVDELIATAYIRQPINECEYLVHIDGDVKNNKLENLKWENYIHLSRELWWYTIVFRDKDWNIPKFLDDKDCKSGMKLVEEYKSTLSRIPGYKKPGQVTIQEKTISMEFITAFDHRTHEPIKMFTCIDDAVDWMIDRDTKLSISDEILMSIKDTKVIKRLYNDMIRASMSSQSVAGVRYMYNLYLKAKRFRSTASKSDKLRTAFVYDGLDFDVVSKLINIPRTTLNPAEVFALKPKAIKGLVFCKFFTSDALSIDSTVFVYHKLYNGDTKYEQK